MNNIVVYVVGVVVVYYLWFELQQAKEYIIRINRWDSYKQNKQNIIDQVFGKVKKKNE